MSANADFQSIVQTPSLSRVIRRGDFPVSVLYPKCDLVSRDTQISIWMQQTWTSASIWMHAKKGHWYATWQILLRNTVAVEIIHIVSFIVSRSPDMVTIASNYDECDLNILPEFRSTGVLWKRWHRRRVCGLWSSVSLRRQRRLKV